MSNNITQYKTPKYKTILDNPMDHPTSRGNYDNATLIPKHDLDDVIAELEQTIQPCAGNYAHESARVLIGMYPIQKDIPDPKSYALGIKSVLLEAPAHIVKRVVDELSRKYKVVPTRAHVQDAIDAHVGKHRAMIYRAKKMKIEHERREKKEIENNKIEEQKRELKEKFGDNYLEEFFKTLKPGGNFNG